MKQLRSSFWGKVLAVLLIAASSFATVYFGCLAALELACFGVGEWSSVVAHYYDSSSYNGETINHYLLSLGEDSLTYLGRQEYDALAEELNPEKTNFRYRILDMEGNTLYTNAGESWDTEVDGDCVQRAVCSVEDLYRMGAVQDYLASEPQYYRAEALRSGICFFPESTAFQTAHDAMMNLMVEVQDIIGVDGSGYAAVALFFELWQHAEYMGQERQLWQLLYLLATEYQGTSYQIEANGVREVISMEKAADLPEEGLTERETLRQNQILRCLTELADDPTLVDQALDSMWSSMGAEDASDTAYWEDAFAHLRERSKSVLTAFSQADYCILEWSVAVDLPVSDGLKIASVRFDHWKKSFKNDCAVTALTGLVGLLSLIWLLYSCGHAEGVEGLHLSTLERFPQDVMFALTAAAEGALLWGVLYLGKNITLYKLFGQSVAERYLMCGVAGLAGTLLVLLLLPFLVGSTAQLKAHSFWRRTLVAHVLRLIGRLFESLGALVRGMALGWRGAIAYTAVWAAAAMTVILLETQHHWAMILMAALWMAGLMLVVRWCSGWGQIRKAGSALAEGDLTYQTETGSLPWDLKEHAAHLNDASRIVEEAVQEQMRSDRFRTELITNVSHDLKTPLTSIINYVDLLKKLNLQDETARGYLEVLDRKSQRLKTLTEDLVEASKASAGVLPVNMERLEAGELLRQAAGEYEDKFRAAQLEFKLRTPEEPVWIMADGHHTWRILDNFFSNCTKYAMPGTRVYVDAVREEGEVLILVKNVSADPLNIPAEELMERFVRGDSSRTTEGSGLGLSIAQSLARLQGAEVALEVDGDLFKAILIFPAAPEAPAAGAPESGGD